MVMRPAQAPSPHTFAHSLHVPEHALPKEAIELSILKPLEELLRTRGILSTPLSQRVHPLWFLAETARNVFLWRSGLSLLDQDHFEFWIDPVELAKQQLERLARTTDASPFDTPAWGTEGASTPLRDQERYFDSLLELLHKVEDHAHILGRISALVCKEMGREDTRTRVLLPQRRVTSKGPETVSP